MKDGIGEPNLMGGGGQRRLPWGSWLNYANRMEWAWGQSSEQPGLKE